jgi:hypothetical protein
MGQDSLEESCCEANRKNFNLEDFEKPPKTVAFNPKAFIGWGKRKGKSKFSLICSL